MDDLIGEFIEETAESLAALKRELAAPHIGHDTWENAYKIVHTIKGTCGFLGLKRLEHVAGSTEMLLQDIRDGKVQPSHAISQVVGEAVGRLDTIVVHLSQYGSEPPGDDRALLAQLQNIDQFPEPEPLREPYVPPQAPEAPRAQARPFATPLPDMAAMAAAAAHASPAVKEMPKPKAAAPAKPVNKGELAARVLSGLVVVRNQLKALAGVSGDSPLDASIAKLSQIVRTLKREAGAANVAAVMVIESGGQHFAFLQDEIAEVVRIHDSMLSDADMPVLRHGHNWIPLKSLRSLMLRPGNRPEQYAIILRAGEQKFAVSVEHLGPLEEVALAALPGFMGSITLYHGATLLGDNAVCLILSANGIMQTQTEKQPAPHANEEEIMPPAMPARAPSHTAFLVFAAGDGVQKAMPLAEVKRVESVHRGDVDHSGPAPMVNLRGEWIRLTTLPGCSLPEYGHFQLILLNHAPSVGLVAHTTHGIMQAMSPPAQANIAAPYMARMVLDNKMTDVVDALAVGGRESEAA